MYTTLNLKTLYHHSLTLPANPKRKSCQPCNTPHNMESALSFKASASAHFSALSYPSAIACYASALASSSSVLPPTSASLLLSARCLSNLAICRLLTLEHGEAAEAAERGLGILEKVEETDKGEGGEGGKDEGGGEAEQTQQQRRET